MKNKIRAIAPVIIALILIVVIIVAGVIVYFVAFATKPSPGPGPGPGQGFQISKIENYGDLVDYVTHIKYRWTLYEGGETSIGVITFDDLGDETVNGYLCRKFNLLIESNGDINEISGWVLKSDWTTLKKLIYDGTPVPEEYLSMYAGLIESVVFLPYVTFFGWNIDWTQVTSEIGTLTSIGSESRIYGETTLTVYKWRFTPNPIYEPLKDVSSIEVWQGQIGSYYLLTYFDETKKDGDYTRFELLEFTP
jgi:hypothetical protein